MKFHIICAMYNFSSWVQKNIEVLKAQTFSDFECLLLDDMSNDDTVEKAIQAINDDPRFHLIRNETKKFKARNVYDGIYASNASAEDVIVMIDGDDCLAHERVLEKLHEVYRDTACWMTYGSYQDSQNGQRDAICQPYEDSVINANNYRQVKWRASHLKTFKFALWQKIRKDAFCISSTDYKQALKRALLQGRLRTFVNWKKLGLETLHEQSGQFIRRVDDKAFTYPMLEMAGEKAVFIEDVMYIYNVDNQCFAKTTYGNHGRKWPGRLIRDALRHKSPYPRLKSLDD